MEIILYTNGCPQCRILHKKLDSTGLQYKVVDNVDEVVKKAEELGIQSAPFMLVDGEVYTFTEAVKLCTEPNFVQEERS